MKKFLIVIVALFVFSPLAVLAGEETGASATAGAGAEAKLEVNYPSPKRMLPNGTPVNPYPSSQFFQQKAVRTWNLSPLKELAQVRMVWTRRQLEVIVSHAPGNDGDVSAIPYNAVPSQTPRNTRSPNDIIAILIGETLPEGYFDRGSVIGIGDEKTYGRKMSAAVLLAALNMGATHYMVLIDDSAPIQGGTSYGLMLGGNRLSLAQDAGSGAIGSVAIGGVGWGKIKTKLGLEPFLDGFALTKGHEAQMRDKITGNIVPVPESAKQRIYTVAYETYDAQSQLADIY